MEYDKPGLTAGRSNFLDVCNITGVIAPCLVALHAYAMVHSCHPHQESEPNCTYAVHITYCCFAPRHAGPSLVTTDLAQTGVMMQVCLCILHACDHNKAWYGRASQGQAEHGRAGHCRAGQTRVGHLVRQLYISLEGQQKGNACQSALQVPIKPPTGCHMQRGLPILHSTLRTHPN